jgi:3-oxoacyl-[acyl-carrier-protein] synthase III
MIGISYIAYEIADRKVSNLDRADELDASEDFIRDKIGMINTARKPEDWETSDLGVAAAEKAIRGADIDPVDIDCLIVVTQNPDGNGLPHTSAIVHKKLRLSENCAAFDISLGCSGYVYALSIISSFMTANELNCGLLITADPYSKIVNEHDRNTAMLFGDAASATIMTQGPIWRLGNFDFGTKGELHDALEIDDSGKLFMNGRAIFNFSATGVPKSIQRCLERNATTVDEIDLFVLHQGSKFIVDTIGRRINAAEKTPFLAAEYGNAVSSSIPIILADIDGTSQRRIVISGFGVGLSWGTALLEWND